MAPAHSPRARLVVTVAGAVVAGLAWRSGNRTAVVLGGVAVLLGLLGWLGPTWFAPVQRGLDRFAHGIVVATSWLLLALVYLGLFVPLRVWRALTRRDPLARRADRHVESYLTPLPPAAARRFERQF